MYVLKTKLPKPKLPRNAFPGACNGCSGCNSCNGHNDCSPAALSREIARCFCCCRARSRADAKAINSSGLMGKQKARQKEAFVEQFERQPSADELADFKQQRLTVSNQ